MKKTAGKKIRRRRAAFAAMLLFVLLFPAVQAAAEKQVSKVTCLSAVSIKVDQTVNLKASAPSTLTYASDDPGIAVVDSSGNVKGVSEGSTTIRAASRTTRKYTGTLVRIPVTVTRNSQSVISSDVYVKAGETAGLIAKARTSLSFTCSDTTVAVVTPEGRVKGIRPGTAAITIRAKATRKWNSASTRIQVVVADRSVTVTLCRTDGSCIRKAEVPKGSSFKVPVYKNGSSSTFLGWSRKAGLTPVSSNPWTPEWPCGTVIENLTSDLTLYTVYSPFSRVKVPSMQTPDRSRYSHVFFVGDSRTLQLEKLVRGSQAYDSRGISFVCRYGRGLSWFMETGCPELIRLLEKTDTSKKPAAVIMNLGVNDLENLAAYRSCLPELVKNLKKYNCRLFYVSVNPFNSTQIKEYIKATGNSLKLRDEADLLEFNAMLKANAASAGYTYIDLYSWLISRGYSTKCGTDDGLHYSEATAVQIYNMALRAVNSR